MVLWSTDAQPTHLEFIISAANLHAFNYGLKGSSDLSHIKKVLDSVHLPEFVPKSGVQVQVKDDEPVANDKDAAAKPEEDDVATLAASLPQPSSLAGYRMVPAQFEKDDDTNHHMDFITAACASISLRALFSFRSKLTFLISLFLPFSPFHFPCCPTLPSSLLVSL
jgi:hypothetical protein